MVAVIGTPKVEKCRFGGVLMKKDNRTVCVKLRFWTNDLAVKHHGRPSTACWDGGVLIIEQNKSKGIRTSNPIPFNNFEDIVPAIKEILRKNHVLVVSANKRERIMNSKRKSR